jgi:ribosomal protein S27E
MVQVVSTTPHPSVVKEVVCRNCGSTLAYVPADVTEKIEVDYTGGRDVVKYITCPPCGNKQTVS